MGSHSLKPRLDELRDPLFLCFLLLVLYALIGVCGLSAVVTRLFVDVDESGRVLCTLVATCVVALFIFPVLALLAVADEKSTQEEAEAAKGEEK